jgi:branched-chain amino acid transport system ATP-binding protein
MPDAGRRFSLAAARPPVDRRRLRVSVMTAVLPLTVENVSCVFGGLRAVDGVTLTIRPGERRALIGPNGAGKTTLFNLISGELPVTSGAVVLFGMNVTKLPPHRRAARGLGRTFQITRLFPNLTVVENVLLACEALDRRRFTVLRPLSSCVSFRNRADTLLAEFGLSALAREQARRLSYGDQRKLEVALALAGRPRLLLLDEPMAGLSGAERDGMRRVLHALDPEMAVLLIEHDMDVAFALAETVTVLCQGAVLASGPPADIAANQQVQQVYLGVPPL